jgi:hypothetical protein
MKKLSIFITGMLEFRQNSTSNFNNQEIETYDSGRDFAHFLTFRIFE